MKYLFHLGHPAHFHLFRNTINILISRGHKVKVLIKKKDILEDLLRRSGMDYLNILPEGRGDGKAGLAMGMLKRDWRLLKSCISDRPDLLIGTSTEIGHIGAFLRIPSINVNEDDAAAVPLYSKLSYPLSDFILSPDECNNGKWEYKSIKYKGYHELAYLHPKVFTPSAEVVSGYLPVEKPYFLIRFARLNAHHDKGVRGISDTLASKLISELEPYGNIFITSERVLDRSFEKFRLKIDPLDIHHVMAFAALYIGDSQTMAAEAGVLGVPFVRFNDFVGKLGYLNELEKKYGLGYGIDPVDGEMLVEVVKKLVREGDLRNIYGRKRAVMLSEKINLTSFMVWLFENFPVSVTQFKTDPGIQFSF